MSREILSPGEKALAVNVDPNKYGTFAEIGAGQEVARWFFRAGKASSTIAKTMSAYDMVFSDAIYGAEDNKRYVCEPRLNKMLDKEYNLLNERLSGVRDPSTKFFVFADTVASKKAVGGRGGHGWLGVRFQHEAGAEPSEVVVHVHLMDHRVLDQQEAIGVVGTNLIYGCFFLHHVPETLIDSLTDNLKYNRIEIDMLRMKGPAFENVDNRIMSLQLVKKHLTNAVLFSPSGETLQPSDALFRKHLLVQRGRFRPVTRLHLDMLRSGIKQFLTDPAVDEKDLVPFMEMTVSNFVHDGKFDVSDFLARVDLLGKLGHYVMISNYAEFYRLSEFFSKYTRGKVGIVIGVGHLPRIFDEKNYQDVGGGLLEALGSLFRANVRALIYPAHSLSVIRPGANNNSDQVLTSKDYEPPEHLQHLYHHMMKNHSFEDIQNFDREVLRINSDEVLEHIVKGNSAWKEMVPPETISTIEERKLFTEEANGDAA